MFDILLLPSLLTRNTDSSVLLYSPEAKPGTPTQPKKESETNPKPSVKTSGLRLDLTGHLLTYISILNMRLITCTSVHKWSENQSYSFFLQQIQPPFLTRKAFKAPITNLYIHSDLFISVGE